ncbi:hypothetical protein CVV43_02035 [Candidatus Saccharibacteria bacterium HGW-Saccharibacteria-1]|nr:MAG: hypothetical protein CVV43_02035 [Candidatus Saccharibacteria bacterium HGW-Saccharibacteria-1]
MKTKNVDDKKSGIVFLDKFRNRAVEDETEKTKSQMIQSSDEKSLIEEIGMVRLRVQAAEANLKHEKDVRFDIKAKNEPRIKEIEKKIETLKNADGDVVFLVNDKNIDSRGEYTTSFYLENPHKKEISALKEEQRVLTKQIKATSVSVDTGYELLASAMLSLKELESDLFMIQKSEQRTEEPIVATLAADHTHIDPLYGDDLVGNPSFFEKVSEFFGRLLSRLPFRK